MNSKATKLFIFTLPQRIELSAEENKLFCNIVVMPKFNPLEPLAKPPEAGRDFVSFVNSNVQFNSFLVKGNELLPTLTDHDESIYKEDKVLLPPNNADRKKIFEDLAGFFTIEDDLGRDSKPGKVKKYLPESYREAYGFAGAVQGAVTDESYFCALKGNKFEAFDEPNKDTVNWAQVMAFCLNQPALAVQLGLLYKNVEIKIPDAEFFAEGGWLYLDLQQQPGIEESYHDLPLNLLQRYAAWIPPVIESRPLFSPVLFPVEELEPVGTFDDVFDEVVKYSDGYAKIVHTSQPVSTNHLKEKTDGNSPLSDMGIRIAWDDEQVLEWYNRGMDSMEKIGADVAGVSDTPLAVSKYRVDVAVVPHEIALDDIEELEKNLTWKSQVSVEAENLSAGEIDLGRVEMEMGIQVLPAKHGDGATDNYWLPAYFTNWNGTCLSLPDPLPEEINQLELVKEVMSADRGQVQPKMMFVQKEEDKMPLQYGNTYAFRVRLSDISGGGPEPGSFSKNRGEHKIALQKFKRYVTPQLPAITMSDDLQSMIITRSRLNYPAIMFTGQDNIKVAEELILDRKQLIKFRDDHDNHNLPNRKWLREVSLPDPDVTQVEIVVEIKTLEMDREDSYNSRQKVTPKDPYVFLYKTFRDFPAYELKHDREDDDINLPLIYENISRINFSDLPEDLGFINHIHEGPLVLPSARDIRISIRSFCPNEKPDYFGSDDSRRSMPVIQILRRDPAELEPENLFLVPEDALLSIFFLPQPKSTPQFREEQKMKGKGNEADSDLLDRLASITALVHKSGSITGKDNVRTQFGCSALLNHSIGPDRSSVTFSSRDDFYHRWINVIQLDLNRDWTWDLLKPDSFIISRKWKFEGEADFMEEALGGIYLTNGLNWQAMSGPDRSFTKLIFIDALDPKPAFGKFPETLEVEYIVKPQFKQVDIDGIATDLGFDPDQIIQTLSTKLPITTKPTQVPKIIATGIALTPDSSEEVLFANRYSETADRKRYLWIQFDKPIADPKDMYFGRVLAYAPDHMLSAIDEELKEIPYNGFDFNKDERWPQYVKSEQLEPPINLDPEVVRVVRPGQPFDQSGLEAMQPLIPESAGEDHEIERFLLPLPPGIHPDSEELFGFFTYEFRVGHFDPLKWSTSQGRFGSPLRQTGVQHPAPQMLLNTLRSKDKVLVNTRHAQSFFRGKNLTPEVPRTYIHACLYAQVLQADGVQFRNILLDRIPLLKPTFTTDVDKINTYLNLKEEKENPKGPFSAPDAPVLLPGTPPYAVGFWDLKDVRLKLRYLGIDANASLSVLAIEFMPRNDFYRKSENPNNPFIETPPLPPEDFVLNQLRILRTSRLCPVTETCAIEA